CYRLAGRGSVLPKQKPKVPGVVHARRIRGRARQSPHRYGCGVFCCSGERMAGHRYLHELKQRVLIYDGAMETSIQELVLRAADFGGPDLEGSNDYHVITHPDAIAALHASLLAAGADVLETAAFR